MNDTYDLRVAETHIEVHQFRGGAIVAATLLALLVQTSLPVYFPKFSIIDLPLLITIYFGLSRRNPSTGLLLGMNWPCTKPTSSSAIDTAIQPGSLAAFLNQFKGTDRASLSKRT